MLARWSRDIKYTLNIACQMRYARMSAALYNKRVYTDTDEWIHNTNGGEAQIGITANAIEQLNEVVYIEYQLKPGDKAEKGDDIVLIESVKATDAIQAPFDLVVIQNNESLEECLDALNENPEQTWLVKVERKDDLFTL